MMEEHVAAGVLTAKTHWRDYCMKVANLVHFTVLEKSLIFLQKVVLIIKECRSRILHHIRLLH